MSDKFNILEYLNQNPDRLARSRREIPFVMPSFDQNTDADTNQDALNNALRRHLQPNAAAATIIIRQVHHIDGTISRTSTQGPSLERTVSRDVVVNAVRPYAKPSRTTCYWQDAGWEKRNGHLIGHYVADGKSFAGSIELTNSIVVPMRFYIYNPPVAVLRGPHGLCFRDQGKVAGTQKYWIHFSEEPADVDSGIVQIQRDLSAAISAE